MVISDGKTCRQEFQPGDIVLRAKGSMAECAGWEMTETSFYTWGNLRFHEGRSMWNYHVKLSEPRVAWEIHQSPQRLWKGG